jgi:hypothetical protein
MSPITRPYNGVKIVTTRKKLHVLALGFIHAVRLAEARLNGTAYARIPSTIRKRFRPCATLARSFSSRFGSIGKFIS